jgi:hypothetical protein
MGDWDAVLEETAGGVQVAGEGVVTGMWEAWDGIVSLKKSGWQEETSIRMEYSCTVGTQDMSDGDTAAAHPSAAIPINAAELADSSTFSQRANQWGAVCYELVGSCPTPVSMPAQLDNYPSLRSLGDVICQAGKEDMWIEELWFNSGTPLSIMYQVFHKVLRDVYKDTAERRKLNLYRYFIETKDMKAGAGKMLLTSEEEGAAMMVQSEGGVVGGGSSEGGKRGSAGGEGGSASGEGGGADGDESERHAKEVGEAHEFDDDMTSAEIVAMREMGKPVDTGRPNLLHYCMSDNNIGGKHYDGTTRQSTLQALDEGYAYNRENDKFENKYGSPKKAKNKKKATLIKQSAGAYGTEEKKIGKRTFDMVKTANAYFEGFHDDVLPYARSDGTYMKKPEEKKKKKNVWDEHEDEFPPIEMYHHRVSLAHGQLTSSNIVLDPCGNVWLLGFGFWQSGGWGGFGAVGDDGVTNGVTKQPILVDVARLFSDVCFKQTKLESTIELTTATKIIANIIASEDLRFAAKEAKARYDGKEKKEETPHAPEPHTHGDEDDEHNDHEEHHEEEHHEEEDVLTLADRLVGETKFEMLHTMLLHLLQYAGSYVSEGSDHRGDCDWHMLNLLFPLMRFCIFASCEATKGHEAAQLAVQKKMAAAEAAEMARNAYHEAAVIIEYMDVEVPQILQEAEAREVAQQLANASLAEDPDAVLPPLPKVRDTSVPKRKRQRTMPPIPVIDTCLQRRWAVAAAAQCAARIHAIFENARLVHEEAVEKLNGDELTNRQRREQERLFVSCWGDTYMDVPEARKAKAAAEKAAEEEAAAEEGDDEDESEDESEDEDESEEEEEDEGSPMLKNMLSANSDEALLLDKARYGLQMRSEHTWVRDPMTGMKLDILQQYAHLRLIQDHDDPSLYDEKGRRVSKGKIESAEAAAEAVAGKSSNNDLWALHGNEVDLPDVFMFVMQQMDERLPVGHRVMMKCRDWEPEPEEPKSSDEESSDEDDGLPAVEELKVGGIAEEETAEDIADDDVSGKEDGPKGEDLVLLKECKKDFRACISAFRATVWEAFQAFDVEGKGSLDLKDYRGAILMMDMAMPDGKTLEFMQNEIGKNHNQETEFEHLRRFMLMQAIITATDTSEAVKFDLKPHPCELRPKSRRLFGELMVWKKVPRDWVLPRPLLLLGEAGAGKTMALRQMMALWSTQVDTAASSWSDPLLLIVPVRELMIAMRAHDEMLLTAKAAAAEEGEDLDANEGFKAGSISRKPRNPAKLMASEGADILTIYLDHKFTVGTTRWALMKRLRSLRKLVVVFDGIESAHYPIIDDEMFPKPAHPAHVQPEAEDSMRRSSSSVGMHRPHGNQGRKQSRVKVDVRKQIKPWHYAEAIATFLNNFLCEELMVVATSTDGGLDLSKFDWFLKARIQPFNDQQVDFVAVQRYNAPEQEPEEEKQAEDEWDETAEYVEEYPQAVEVFDEIEEDPNQLVADGSMAGCVKEGELLLSAFRELVYKFEEYPNDMYNLDGALVGKWGAETGGGGGAGPEYDGEMYGEIYDDDAAEVASEVGDYGFTATADYGFSSTYGRNGGPEEGLSIPRLPRLPQVRSYMQDLFPTLCTNPLMLNGMLTALTQLGAWNAQEAVKNTHANHKHGDPKHTIKAAGSMERNQFFGSFVYQSLRCYIRAHEGFTVLNPHNGAKEETGVDIEEEQVGLLTKLLQLMAFTAQKRKKTALTIREIEQLLHLPDPEDDSDSEDEDGDGAKAQLFDEVDALHALADEDIAPLQIIWQWLLYHLVRSDNMMPLLTCQPFDQSAKFANTARDEDDDDDDDAPINRVPTLEEEEENGWYASYPQFRRRCTIRFAHLSIQHYLAARSMTSAMLKFCYQKEGGFLDATAAMKSTVKIGDPNGVDGGFRYCSEKSLDYFEVPPYTHLIHLYVPMLAAGKGGEGGEPVQMFADDWWERVVQFVYEGSQVGLRALEVSRPLADAHTQHAPKATKEELLAAQFAAEAAAAIAAADEEAAALAGAHSAEGPKAKACSECCDRNRLRAATYARRKASIKMRNNTKSEAEKAGGGGGGGGSIPWEAAQETFIRPLPLRLLNDLSVDILKQNYQTGKLCVQNVLLNQRQMKTLGLLLLCHKQLRKLEVENPDLSPRCVLLLARACCHHQLLRKLTVTPYGVELPVQVLKGSSGVPVRKLDLGKKGVGFKDVLALGTLLAHNGILRSLDLTDATITNAKMVDGRVMGEYREEGAIALAGALRGPCSCVLRRLELGGCGLGLVSLSSFSLLCRALRGNKILRALGLQNNHLPTRAGGMLGGLLRANDSLHELNLSGNQLVEYWNAEDLAADLAADVFGRRFGGGEEAIQAFGGGPAKSLTSLTEEKTGPKVKEAELVESRSMGFLPKNRYLPEGGADEDEVAAALNMPAARAARGVKKGSLDTVEDLHGVTALASGLRDNRTLRKLDVSNCCLGVAGIKVLAHYLTIPDGTPMKIVEETAGEAAIGVDGIELQGSVVLAVGDAEVYTGVLQELNCSNNVICGLFKFQEGGEVKEIGFYDPGGATALAKAVGSQKAVVTLNIENNSVRTKDKRLIRGMLGCQAREGDVDLRI